MNFSVYVVKLSMDNYIHNFVDSIFHQNVENVSKTAPDKAYGTRFLVGNLFISCENGAGQIVEKKGFYAVGCIIGKVLHTYVGSIVCISRYDSAKLGL